MNRIIVLCLALVCQLPAHAKDGGAFVQALEQITSGVFASEYLPKDERERRLLLKAVSCDVQESSLAATFDYRENSKLALQVKKIDSSTVQVIKNDFVKKTNEFSMEQETNIADRFQTLENLNRAITTKKLNKKELAILNANDGQLIESITYLIKSSARSVNIQVMESNLNLDNYITTLGKYRPLGWVANVQRLNDLISGDYDLIDSAPKDGEMVSAAIYANIYNNLLSFCPKVR